MIGGQSHSGSGGHFPVLNLMKLVFFFLARKIIITAAEKCTLYIRKQISKNELKTDNECLFDPESDCPAKIVQGLKFDKIGLRSSITQFRYLLFFFSLRIYVLLDQIRHSALFIHQYDSRLTFDKGLKENEQFSPKSTFFVEIKFSYFSI